MHISVDSLSVLIPRYSAVPQTMPRENAEWLLAVIGWKRSWGCPIWPQLRSAKVQTWSDPEKGSARVGAPVAWRVPADRPLTPLRLCVARSLSFTSLYLVPLPPTVVRPPCSLFISFSTP